MTPARPHLLRALNEWILDNQCTPYVVVDAEIPGVEVPVEFIKDGQIVLNINPSAVRHLSISNSVLTFEARFGGKPCQIYVPTVAVTAIYAKENGQGMVFGPDNDLTDPDGTSPTSSNGHPVGVAKKRPGPKPVLTVVK